MTVSAEYTAGFLDGEGAITLIRGGQTIRVSVAQVDLSVLEVLQRAWGGSIRMQKDGVVRAGRRRAGERRRIWVWNVSSWESVDLLLAVLPYLIVKRADAREALQVWVAWQRDVKSKTQMPPSFYARLRAEGKEANLWTLSTRGERRREQIRRRTIWLTKLAEVEAALDEQPANATGSAL